MGFLDRAKKMAKRAKGTVDDLAEEHGDQIKGGLRTAADAVDDRTGGKHREKLDKAVTKASGVVDDLAQPDRPTH